jgi:small subunit ribosomal protein S17
MPKTAATPAPTKPAPEKKLVTLRGVVESDKRDKTRKVVVSYSARHPKYGKYMRRETVIHAHDEKNTSRLGDVVEVAPCRPMSKTKTWRVTRVVESKPRD